MKVDYTPKYDYEALYKIIKKLLEKRKLAIVREEFQADKDDYYCNILFKLFNRNVNIHLTPLGEEIIGLGYSYWASENRVKENNSPVIEYSIIEIPSESKKLEKIFKQSFHTFMEMIKVYSKINKEIEDGEVKFQF